MLQCNRQHAPTHSAVPTAYTMNKMYTAIATHPTATAGDARSPIRASFHGMPSKPVRWAEIHEMRGLRNAMVQINRRTTVSMLVKSKMADCEGARGTGRQNGGLLASAAWDDSGSLRLPAVLTIAPSCPKRQGCPFGTRLTAPGSAVRAC